MAVIVALIALTRVRFGIATPTLEVSGLAALKRLASFRTSHRLLRRDQTLASFTLTLAMPPDGLTDPSSPFLD
jgi:hypothetical protein